MDRDIITVYLLLRSKGELSWEDLLRESSLDVERLSRIVLLLQLKQYVKKEGNRLIFLGKKKMGMGGNGDKVLECTDYYHDRLCEGPNEGKAFRSVNDILELKIRKRVPLEIFLDGKSLPAELVINLDRGEGKIEIVYDKKVLSVPHYIDYDSLLIDVFEVFQFYKKYAEKKGDRFLISNAYSLFHKIANCDGEEEESPLSPCHTTTQLEFDASSTCFQICRAITEILNIENITLTIDTITRACQLSEREIRDLKKLDFLKKYEISTAYTFPLSPFEIGILVMGKRGTPLCLLNGYQLFAEIPVRETPKSIEIDFSKVVEKYAENAKTNNGKNSFDIDKISKLFFSMFNEEKNVTDLEESLSQLQNREEIDLLNTLHLISCLTLENQTKEVTAKITYKTRS
ncbi:MAG: hypothetical protein KIH10_01970 [Candidatus Freyarchaeota archaeon]|nr:hypothetical protein [Candidatus Jordarchaeia archaeon]MBS7278790.1 hypothetical protein [Candidatus Jordarchaeia archaeon]